MRFSDERTSANDKQTDGEGPVSQFTLLATTKKGNKPDFHKLASPSRGLELYTAFFKQVRALYSEDRVKDGVFGAMMDVGLVNDGPVCVAFRCEDEAVQFHFGGDLSMINTRFLQLLPLTDYGHI